MKADRHNRIVELVTVYNIETQEELVGFFVKAVMTYTGNGIKGYKRAWTY